MQKQSGLDQWLLTGTALLGLGGVIGGAIAAHPPEGFFAGEETRNAWNSASLFLLFHVLAILAIADLRNRRLAPFRSSVIFFLIGILLFSGSIFALAAGAPKFLGPVTPVGGLFLIGAWISLALQLRKRSGE